MSRLPEYENPPLNEVVFGVQFEPLAKFRSSHAGLYWSRIRSRFPGTEDKPPLAYQIEGAKPTPAKQEIELISGLPSPRVWFVSDSKTTLVQVQRDWFLSNWRRIDGTEEYPRYVRLSQQFLDDWNGFVDFARDERLGDIAVSQCELSYVNHLEPGVGWKDFSDLGSLFAFLKPSLPEIGKPDIFEWSSRYALPKCNGAAHVRISTVFRARDLKLVLAMNLTVRGAPSDPSQMAEWFEAAHDWIVRSFDELTHPQMHDKWGKKT